MDIRIRRRLEQLRFRLADAVLPSLPRSAPLAGPSPPPTSGEARELAAECRRILDENLAGFFLQAPDRRNGGYLEDCVEGGFFDRGDKLGMMQARQLWFFSLLAGRGVRAEAARDAAAHGFAFIEQHLRDPEHGGYYLSVASDGRVLDDTKHLRHQAFFLYGLSAYARHSEAAAAAADALFDRLEASALDPANAGYRESLLRDWSPAPEGVRLPETRSGFRSFNTALHIMEALTEFYRVRRHDRARRRLEGLLLDCLVNFRHPWGPYTLNYWHAGSREPLRTAHNLRFSYGHDVEAVWLSLEACRALGMREQTLLVWAEQVVGDVLRHGVDPGDGGVFTSGRHRGGRDLITGRQKLWWVQGEVMVALLEVYSLTRKPVYFEAFRRVLSFVRERLVAPEGGWWSSPAPPRMRASRHQGGYHSGRSMARSADLLGAIADRLEGG